MLCYFAVLTLYPEVGGYTATFPDVPGAITEADTTEETLKRAADALETVLAFYVETNRPLPVPRRPRPRNAHTVELSATAEAKLLLYGALRAAGMRKTTLARKLRLSAVQVDRLLDPSRSSPMEAIEGALALLGKRLSLQVQDVA